MYENENQNVSPETTAMLGGGGVAYSLEDAVTPIEELITALEEMKRDGIEHVVMSSGNTRGPMWATVTGDWSWVSDE